MDLKRKNSVPQNFNNIHVQKSEKNTDVKRSMQRGKEIGVKCDGNSTDTCNCGEIRSH